MTINPLKRERDKAYREANRVLLASRQRAYHEANRDRELARSKAYRNAAREKKLAAEITAAELAFRLMFITRWTPD